MNDLVVYVNDNGRNITDTIIEKLLNNNNKLDKELLYNFLKEYSKTSIINNDVFHILLRYAKNNNINLNNELLSIQGLKLNSVCKVIPINNSKEYVEYITSIYELEYTPSHDELNKSIITSINIIISADFMFNFVDVMNCLNIINISLKLGADPLQLIKYIKEINLEHKDKDNYKKIYEIIYPIDNVKFAGMRK